MKTELVRQSDNGSRSFRHSLSARLMSILPYAFIVFFCFYLYWVELEREISPRGAFIFFLFFVPFTFLYYWINNLWESLVVDSRGIVQRRFFKETVLPWDSITSYSYGETDRLLELFLGVGSMVTGIPGSLSAKELELTTLRRPPWRNRPELSLFDGRNRKTVLFQGLPWDFYLYCFKYMGERGFEVPESEENS